MVRYTIICTIIKIILPLLPSPSIFFLAPPERCERIKTLEEPQEPTREQSLVHFSSSYPRVRRDRYNLSIVVSLWRPLYASSRQGASSVQRVPPPHVNGVVPLPLRRRPVLRFLLECIMLVRRHSRFARRNHWPCLRWWVGKTQLTISNPIDNILRWWSFFVSSEGSKD